ncbi:MAG TPA: endonuclease/exonuclease/phosphatase family protein [Bryobacteraceae bacterium]|nr:endonuclease/exonuclease/phosphatase family protein [Bryobacteraceae bacterium]
MRALWITSAVFVTIWLLEGQTGSSSASRLPSIFDTPRQIHEPSAKVEGDRLRIMTWNIDRGTRLEQIAAEMAEHPADVNLLQEVDLYTARVAGKDVATELAHRLQMNSAYGIEFEELSQEQGKSAYIGQATLARLPLQQARVLRFKRQSGFWKPRRWLPSTLPLMQRRLGSRIALVSEFQFAGRLLVVYNAHLESRSAGPIQAAQLDEIVNDAKRYPEGTVVVLGGDLNTKYLPSRFLHKLQQDGYHSALGERIERTHRIAMSLDWLFASGPAQWENGSVRRDSEGSDHFPVYAELLLR